MVFLQACLNGDRETGAPRTPEELAAEARACVAAGAVSLHAHPRGDDGSETLEPAHIAAALRALRAAAPGVELSFSTGLWITNGDVDARMRLIGAWTERPDLVSLNVSEDGWRELADLLAERRIGIEAGVWTARDAELLAESGLVARWGPTAPRARLRATTRRCTGSSSSRARRTPTRRSPSRRRSTPRWTPPRSRPPRLHHGVGPATWAVLDAAVPIGREIRIGLEDVLTLPDGRRAPDNAALVVEASLRYG